MTLEGVPTATPTLIQCCLTSHEQAEVDVEDALVSPDEDGTAKIVLANRSGFTQVLDSGAVIGQANPVVVETPVSTAQLVANQVQPTQLREDYEAENPLVETDTAETPPTEHVTVLQVGNNPAISHSQSASDSRRDKLDTLLAGTDLPQQQMDQLRELLHDHNGAFCFEDGERGETDLVEFHIDTCEMAPLRQRVR